MDLTQGLSDIGLTLLGVPIVTISLLLPGLAFLALVAKKELRPLERICLAAVAGIILYSLLGLLTAWLKGRSQLVIGCVVGIIDIVSVAVLALKREWLTCRRDRSVRLALVSQVLFAVLCLCIGFLDIRYPDTLPDGAYVFKKHRLHVKIQVMTGDLPADNYIPFVFSDYLLRGISFRKERPMLPGQEVTNRTPIMSLVASPFRALFFPPPVLEGPLGTFRYLNTDWPDVEKLGMDDQFRVFLVVAVTLQSLFFLSAFLYLSDVFGYVPASVALGLIALNPYFISQALFTWPKILVGFFSFLTAFFLRKSEHPALSGMLSGLAYLCHPLGVFFIAGNSLWLAVRRLRERCSNQQLLLYFVSVALTVIPWLLWARWIVHIPADLWRQNILVFAPSHRILNFAYVRVVNVFLTFLPTAFMDYPFDWSAVLRQTTFTVAGATGVFLFPFTCAFAIRMAKARSWDATEFACFFLVPAVLICSTFSLPTAACVHGFQAIIPFCVAAAVASAWRSLGRRGLVTAIALQLLFNFFLLKWRAGVLGVFEPGRSGNRMLLVLFAMASFVFVAVLVRGLRRSGKSKLVTLAEFAT